MVWKAGRGFLGPLKPLLGAWAMEAGAGDSAAAGLRCTRRFTAMGDWIMLDACWLMGPGREYREIALFGKGDDGALGAFSFTSDGKRSIARRGDANDLAAGALAFEAQMPAGLARMAYWPRDDGGAGFDFAVESRTKAGWKRFLCHRYRPAG